MRPNTASKAKILEEDVTGNSYKDLAKRFIKPKAPANAEASAASIWK